MLKRMLVVVLSILSLALLRPTAVFAGACACLGVGAFGLQAGSALCSIPTEVPTAPLCVSNSGAFGSINSCTCVSNQNCGNTGQRACDVNDNSYAAGLQMAQGNSTYSCRYGVPTVQGGEMICVGSEPSRWALAEQAPVLVPFTLCDQVGEEARPQCEACSADGSKIWTAVGCIPSDRFGILEAFLRIAVGLSGGGVLISFLAGGFILSTSQGDPNKIKEAKEILTAAIAGALFILFSMVLLNTIGISILRIPGF